MAIIAGIDRKGADGAVNMPALGGDLNDAQIAAIANYSLQTFGNPALSVSSEEVTSLRRGGDAPLLITAMPYLLWGGGLALLVLIIVLVLWRRHHQHLRAVEAKRIALNKVVLAYSGGLDTSVILKWLQDTYNCEVVTFTADLGQGRGRTCTCQGASHGRQGNLH